MIDAFPGLAEQFDEYLDAEFESTTVLRREYRPAEILKGDPDEYRAALREWTDARRQSMVDAAAAALGVGYNEHLLEQLVEACCARRVVPFVGAGLSIPSSLPGWTVFLRREAARMGLEAVVTDMLRRGEFEKAAELLDERMRPHLFDKAVALTFGRNRAPRGAALLLPGLFDGCMITTNFDYVLEDVYRSAGLGFRERGLGAYERGFVRALRENNRYLLKLHGDAKEPETRVLTHPEYELHYGDPPYDDKALPGALQYVWNAHTLLFLGCSLTIDRTLAVFASLTARLGSEQAPTHYALLSDPGDAERFTREQELADHRIFPIWYPAGQHQYVEGFLGLIEDRVA